MSPDADSLDWEDCTGQFQVAASIARGGGGYWPCMVSVDAEELSGTITSEDARALADMLRRAADECDKATIEESETPA